MSRKRRKRKRAREAEAMQVELLEVSDPTPGPERAPTVERSEQEPAPVLRASRDGHEIPERWAKAMGQLKPARRSEAHRAEDQRIQGQAGDAEPGGALEPEGHAAARDHAAAAVRPAGEPLARAKDLVQQGRIQEAIQLYLGILTVNPSNLKAHNNLGVLYDELKRFEAALEHLQEAERLAPENVEVLANYASALTSLARYDEAEELLRRAQRLAPDDPHARLAVGILYFRRGLYQQAEAELRWVCANDTTHGPAFYYRGEALNRLDRYDEAADALQRAIELIPDDPRPFYTLGRLYDRSHRMEDAAEMYREARRLQRR